MKEKRSAWTNKTARPSGAGTQRPWPTAEYGLTRRREVHERVPKAPKHDNVDHVVTTLVNISCTHLPGSTTTPSLPVTPLRSILPVKMPQMLSSQVSVTLGKGYNVQHIMFTGAAGGPGAPGGGAGGAPGGRHQIESPKRSPKKSAQRRLPQSDLLCSRRGSAQDAGDRPLFRVLSTVTLAVHSVHSVT
jgi:hypothetical protein